MRLTKAPLISNTEVMPETRLMWLEAPDIAVTAKPGQFLMVYCGEDTMLRRPFSVHRVDEDRIALLFLMVGKGTRWLAERQKGEEIDIFGPLGNGFTVHPETKNLLLVAGGMGIAPLVFLADRAMEKGKKVTIIAGAHTADCLLPIMSLPKREEMPDNIHVINATDDGSEGFKGMATDLIPAYIDSADGIYACGPVEMYRTMLSDNESGKYGKPVQLSLEIMMACGMGVCYGCTIKTKNGLKQVCKDGPVFNIGELAEELG